MDDPIFPITDEQVLKTINAAIEKRHAGGPRKAIQAFITVALGSLDWVGTFIAAAASGSFAYADAKAGSFEDALLIQWLREKSRHLNEFKFAVKGICDRFESLGEEIDDRIQSEEYLGLVRKAFKVWDDADTAEKKRYVANLITNAGGTKLCSDDIIRLFIHWLEVLHEAHFAVVREINKTPRSTRFQIWLNIHGERVREDSAEADLFGKLISDLSTEHVIRQVRMTDGAGNFYQKPRISQPRTQGVKLMKSRFDSVEPYELTELGKQFVHYTMSEAITRLA